MEVYRRMKKITLRELLSEVEFDYEIENGEIKLIDLCNVYLGDIADFRVCANNNEIGWIISRLENYYEDYDIAWVREILDVGIDVSWEELYKLAESNPELKDKTILPYLLNPELVYIEELENEV